jgi:DNA ligase-1
MTNTGKIQQWTVMFGPHSGNGAQYTVEFGQQYGKLQQTTTYVNAGKNIGKSNETTPLQQAELEARSAWEKQHDRKGYTTYIPEQKPFLPMLAKSYIDDGDKIIFPALAQPKLDGIRCIAYYDNKLDKVVFMSRGGKEFTTLQHLVPEVCPLVKRDGLILDGELYNHKYKSDFQEIISLIKRDSPTKNTSLIQYHVYDSIDDADYNDRLGTLIKHIGDSLHNVKLVPTHQISSRDEVQSYHDNFLKEGYEGMILRNYSGGYELNKRSRNLQKVKKFDSDEFVIVGAEENVGKQAGECTVLCQTKNGLVFGAKPQGSTEVRRKYWQDFQDGKLVGKKLTVSFFGYTNDGVPRFPVGVVVRDYE